VYQFTCAKQKLSHNSEDHVTPELWVLHMKLAHVTLLVATIWRQLLCFWEISGHVINTASFKAVTKLAVV
jgi:hypothetical protein